MAESATFSARDVWSLRRCMEKALRVPRDEIAEGWSIPPVSPMSILDCLSSLTVRPGVALRAYQYKREGNGNGFVFAQPEDAEFPSPETCGERVHEPVPGVRIPVPTPAEAFDHFMDAFEGDGRARAYMEASITLRELGEFGAIWHGCSWSEHTVLDRNPFTHGLPEVSGIELEFLRDESDWTWESHPDEWRPTVKMVAGGGAEVSFVAFNPLGVATIYNARDIYPAEGFRSEGKGRCLAIGKGGMVH
jgi:hypothetical protein